MPGTFASAMLRRRMTRFSLPVTGIDDYVVLGTLRIFEEEGRGNTCFAISYGGSSEAHPEVHNAWRSRNGCAWRNYQKSE